VCRRRIMIRLITRLLVIIISIRSITCIIIISIRNVFLFL